MSVESEPPSGNPFIDESILLGPSDPYAPPVRTAEEWAQGDELGYLETECMYQLAQQQLQAEGYQEDHRKLALLMAQSLSNDQIAIELKLSPSNFRKTVRHLYAYSNLPLYHNLKPVGMAHYVVATGMRQLILHSLIQLSPEDSRDKLLDQSGSVLTQRLMHRAETFNLSLIETKVALLAIKGVSLGLSGEYLGIAPSSVTAHITEIFKRVDCDNRMDLMHRMYGTVQS